MTVYDNLAFPLRNRNVPETLRNTARRMQSAKREKKQG